MTPLIKSQPNQDLIQDHQLANLPKYFQKLLLGGDTTQNGFCNFIFTPAGYPTSEKFVESLVALSLQDNDSTSSDQQIDAIEVGIPFSDPIADGPVIEEAYRLALGDQSQTQSEDSSQKCTLNQHTPVRSIIDVLLLIKEAKRRVKEKSDSNSESDLKPIILMGYMNTFFESSNANSQSYYSTSESDSSEYDPHSGYFQLRNNWGVLAQELNIRHVIITDCTAQHISVGKMEVALGEKGLSLIPVVSENVEFNEEFYKGLRPSTSNDKQDPVLSRKIVYCTAYLGVTGKTNSNNSDSTETVTAESQSSIAIHNNYTSAMHRLRQEGHFILVGFGISTGADVNKTRIKYNLLPNACVVGTAYVKALGNVSVNNEISDSDLKQNKIDLYRTQVQSIINTMYKSFDRNLKVKEVKNDYTTQVTSSKTSNTIPVTAIPKLKVCGYTTREQVIAGIIDGVDLFGFNFYPKSSRYCGECLDFSTTKLDTNSTSSTNSIPTISDTVLPVTALIKNMRYHTCHYNPLSVGVFVLKSDSDSIEQQLQNIKNETLDKIALNGNTRLDIIQFHMDSSLFLDQDKMEKLKEWFQMELAPLGYQYILAIAVECDAGDNSDHTNQISQAKLPEKVAIKLKEYFIQNQNNMNSNLNQDSSIYGLLLDAKVGKQIGGTGHAWNYNLVLKRFYEDYLKSLTSSYSDSEHTRNSRLKLFIAGGVGADSVAGTKSDEIVDLLSPFCDVVFDVCSSVEDNIVDSNTKDYGFPNRVTDFEIGIEKLKLKNCNNLDIVAPRPHKSSDRIRHLLRLVKPNYSPLFYGFFGGAWVSQLILAACSQLDQEYARAKKDEFFWLEFDRLLKKVAGRPTNLYEATSLTEVVRSSRKKSSSNSSNGKQLGARIFLKREDLLHTGAHKINNAIFQIVLAKSMGKKRIICETGAGQHGVACATVCSMLGGKMNDMSCDVYMGAKDAARQKLNVLRIEAMGAKLNAVQTGDKTLRSAINATMRDWASNINDTHYVIGSAVGPWPFPHIVREGQSVISREARKQIVQQTNGKLPACVLGCVGGGSNCLGIFDAFIQDTGVELLGAEAAGKCYSSLRLPNTMESSVPRFLHSGDQPIVLRHIQPPPISDAENSQSIESESKSSKNQYSDKLVSALISLIHDTCYGPNSAMQSEHSCSLNKGSVGILHGSTSIMIQSKGSSEGSKESASKTSDSGGGQSGKSYSICAGLDYSGVSPIHSYLMYGAQRASYASCSDVDAIRGWKMLARTEGILSALESAHAVSCGIERAGQLGVEESVIINLSGRGDKDMATLEREAQKVESLEMIEELRGYIKTTSTMTSGRDSSLSLPYDRLLVLAKNFVVDADLDTPEIELSVLCFFAEFLEFMKKIEDTIPPESVSESEVNQYWFPSPSSAPNLFKMVNLLMAFRETLLTYFAKPFEICPNNPSDSDSESDSGCIVGTGGDSGKNPHNISTPACLLAAAALNDDTDSKFRVLKYGNVSSTGVSSGAADLIGELGANLNDPEMSQPETINQVLESCNFGFLFARSCFPLMKKFGPLRAKFGKMVKDVKKDINKSNHNQDENQNNLPVVTIFNFLGPIINPSNPTYHVFGVSNRLMSQVYALISAYVVTESSKTSSVATVAESNLKGPQAIFNGCKRCLIVHNLDGIDKASPVNGNIIYEIDYKNVNTNSNISKGKLKTQSFFPIKLTTVYADRDFGLTKIDDPANLYKIGVGITGKSSQEIGVLKQVFGKTRAESSESLHNAINVLRIVNGSCTIDRTSSESSMSMIDSCPKNLLALRDFIIMNAALLVHLKQQDSDLRPTNDNVTSLSSSLTFATKRIKSALQTGAAKDQLEKFVYFSNYHAHHARVKQGSSMVGREGIVDRICKSVLLRDCESMLKRLENQNADLISNFDKNTSTNFKVSLARRLALPLVQSPNDGNTNEVQSESPLNSNSNTQDISTAQLICELKYRSPSVLQTIKGSKSSIQNIGNANSITALDKEIISDYIKGSENTAATSFGETIHNLSRVNTVGSNNSSQQTQSSNIVNSKSLKSGPGTGGNYGSGSRELERADESLKSKGSGSVLNLNTLQSNSSLACISVLCEPVFFNGSIEKLKGIKEFVDSKFQNKISSTLDNNTVTSVPGLAPIGNSIRPSLLMKDFFLTKEHIKLAYESQAADCILLIVMLKNFMECSLEEMIETCYSYGLEPIVEVATVEEMEYVIKKCIPVVKQVQNVNTNVDDDESDSIKPLVIGINNRDLRTFETNLNRTQECLVKAKELYTGLTVNSHNDSSSNNVTSFDSVQFKKDLVLVSFSGISRGTDVNRIKEESNNLIRSFLVGTHLMSCANGMIRRNLVRELATASRLMTMVANIAPSGPSLNTSQLSIQNNTLSMITPTTSGDMTGQRIVSLDMGASNSNFQSNNIIQNQNLTPLNQNIHSGNTQQSLSMLNFKPCYPTRGQIESSLRDQDEGDFTLIYRDVTIDLFPEINLNTGLTPSDRELNFFTRLEKALVPKSDHFIYFDTQNHTTATSATIVACFPDRIVETFEHTDDPALILEKELGRKGQYVSITAADSNNDSNIQNQYQQQQTQSQFEPPFVGGFLGYYGFENIAKVEPTIKVQKRKTSSSTTNSSTSQDDHIDDLDDMPLNVLGLYTTFMVKHHSLNDPLSKSVVRVYSMVTKERSITLDDSYSKAVLRINEFYERMKLKLDNSNIVSTSKLTKPNLDSTTTIGPLGSSSNRLSGQNLKQLYQDPDGYYSNFSKEEFLSNVENVKSRIQRGDFIQCVLSRRVTKRTSVGTTPGDIFRQLFKGSASSPYKYYLRIGRGFTIVGASPELLVSVNLSTKSSSSSNSLSGHGSNSNSSSSSNIIEDQQQVSVTGIQKEIQHCQSEELLQEGESKSQSSDSAAYRSLRKITTCPIAGTRPRGKTHEEDIALGIDLLNDTKELAEHVMLVDLARNDIGKLCKQVQVEEYQRIRYYQNVLHICSKVSGIMKVGSGIMKVGSGIMKVDIQNQSDESNESSQYQATALDPLKAIFPAGTLSGAPKVIAVQSICDLERGRRGVYGGGIGYVNFGNTLDMCIGIRTMVCRDIVIDQSSNCNSNSYQQIQTPQTYYQQSYQCQVYLQAGAGIVWDSVPLSEYDETTAKMRNLKLAITKAEAESEKACTNTMNPINNTVTNLSNVNVNDNISTACTSVNNSGVFKPDSRSISNTMSKSDGPGQTVQLLTPSQERHHLDDLADTVHKKLDKIRKNDNSSMNSQAAVLASIGKIDKLHNHVELSPVQSDYHSVAKTIDIPPMPIRQIKNPQNLRVLIVDNYCSFSYNLFQVVAEVVTEEIAISGYAEKVTKALSTQSTGGQNSKNTNTVELDLESPNSPNTTTVGCTVIGGNDTQQLTFDLSDPESMQKNYELTIAKLQAQLLKRSLCGKCTSKCDSLFKFSDPSSRSWWVKDYANKKGHSVSAPKEGHDLVHVVRNDQLENIIKDIDNSDSNGNSFKYSHVIIGPGPKSPSDLPKTIGKLVDFCESKDIPCLGVCLGHQYLCLHYGFDVLVGPQIMHGKISKMEIQNNSESLSTESQSDSVPELFSGLDSSIIADVMRYHSLITKPKQNLDSKTNLEIIATTQHKEPEEQYIKSTQSHNPNQANSNHEINFNQNDKRTPEKIVMAVRHKRARKMFGLQFHPESIGTREGRKMLRNFLTL